MRQMPVSLFHSMRPGISPIFQRIPKIHRRSITKLDFVGSYKKGAKCRLNQLSSATIGPSANSSGGPSLRKAVGLPPGIPGSPVLTHRARGAAFSQSHRLHLNVSGSCEDLIFVLKAKKLVVSQFGIGAKLTTSQPLII